MPSPRAESGLSGLLSSRPQHPPPLSDLDDFLSVVLRWPVGADDRVSAPDDLRGFADIGKIGFLRADSGNALHVAGLREIAVTLNAYLVRPRANPKGAFPISA